MGSISFSLLGEPETRRPSKVRVTFIVLFIVLLALWITFLALYVVERNKSDESTSKTGGQNGTVIPTTSNTTVKPTPTPTPTPSHWNKTCYSPACIISAAGMFYAHARLIHNSFSNSKLCSCSRVLLRMSTDCE